MKTKLTIFFIFTLLLLPSTLNSGRLHFGIISAIKEKVEELKEKKREATDIILAKNTKVLSSEALNNHVKTEGTIYYFNVAATEIGDLQVGDMIIGTKGEGFLRKVTSVNLVDGQYIVDTTDTVLEEAFEKIDIEFKKTLTPADLDPNKSPRLKKGVSIQEVVGEFTVTLSNVILYDHDGNHNTTNDQIVANGSISFKPSIDFKLLLGWFKLKELKFIKIVEQTATVEIKSGIGISMEKEIEIAKYYFAVIPVGPIVFLPEISLVVGANAEIGFEVIIDVTQEATFSVGIHYINGIWNPVSDYSNDFQYNPPSLTAGGEIKGYVGPKLAFKIYGIVGPYVNANGYLQLVAKAFPNLAWTLYGGLEGIGGVEMTILSFVKVNYKATLIDYNREIASSPIVDLWIVAATPSGAVSDPNWLSLSEEYVLLSEIDIDLVEKEAEKEKVKVLYLNYNLPATWDGGGDPERSVIYPLSKIGVDLSDKNTVALWVKGDGRGAELQIDFGSISEDADGTGKFKTEDINLNWSLDSGEDVGWNYIYEGSTYPQGANNGRIDTNDLNGDGFLDTIQSFRAFDSSDDSNLRINWTGWRRIIIPRAGTDSDWSAIKHVRITIRGLNISGSIGIAKVSTDSIDIMPYGI